MEDRPNAVTYVLIIKPSTSLASLIMYSNARIKDTGSSCFQIGINLTAESAIPAGNFAPIWQYTFAEATPGICNSVATIPVVEFPAY